MKVIERPFRVLFVDSSISCYNKLKTNLHIGVENLTFEMSSSSEEAISIIKLKAYDVIIANNEFENITGLEFLEHLRTSGNVTPFILLVRKKSESVYSKAFQLGVNDIIVREDNPSLMCLELKNSIDKIINFSTEVQRRFTDAKSIEDAYTLQTQELEKRLWESNFLYAMPKILNFLDQPQENPFPKLIDLIKETWKSSHLLSIRIIYEGKEYKTDDFSETEWKQSSDILVLGKTIGCVEVYYQESSPTMYESTFLIEALTREISKVTERIFKNIEIKNALESLNISEERNRAYVKAIPDLMLRLDINGIILDHSIPDDFGITFPSKGKKISEMFKSLPQNVIDSFLKAAKKAFISDESTPFEFNLPFDLTEINLKFFETRAVSSGSNEILFIVRDITDKKKAEEATQLREAKEKIEVIINTMADGILVLDAKGEKFLVNQSFKNLYNHIFHKPITDDWNWKSNSEHIFNETIIKLFRDNAYQTIKIEPIQEFHLQMISTLIQTPDLEGFLIITIQDITPFVKFDKIVKQFISTASHELRTPISVIIQSLNNLKKYSDRMSEEVKTKLMDSLHRNANLMYELVDNLLLISRIDERRIQLIWEVFYPFKIFQQVLNQLEPKQKSKNIKVFNNVSENIVLYGDTTRISQIFRILIDNAVKYSHNEGTVKVYAFENYHGLYNPDNVEGVLIEVTDEGIGIKTSDQLLIFDRFFRSQEVSNLPGTGLGLSIAKEIINLHGGEIYLESKYKKGSSFFVFLPRKDKSDINNG